MKKYIFLICCFCGITAFSQSAKVESFQIDDSDNAARVNAVKDFDGNYCALLKVLISDDAVEFRGDFVGTPQSKDMEYDLWMMDGAQRIDIMPSSTLPLSVTFSDYGIGSLKGQSVYVLKVSTPMNQNSATSGALKVECMPVGADIYVDGKKMGQSPTLIRGLSSGKHTVKISADGYSDFTEEVDIKDGFPVEVKGNLNLEFNVNGVVFDIVPVEGGTFLMGATPEQGEDVYDNEIPVHKVTLSSYGIGKTEVTYDLWVAVMGESIKYVGSFMSDWKYFKSSYPVSDVTKGQAIIFCRELSKQTGRHFRLPTEAEWEFAARGGNYSKGYRYSGSDNLDEVAWYGYEDKGNNISNCDNSVQLVATKKPNELGIYDMSGNVAEFVQDMWDDYTEEEQINPLVRKTKKGHSEQCLVRGGSCIYDIKGCYRNACRGGFTRWVSDETSWETDGFEGTVGFRIVLDLDANDFNVAEKRPESKKNVQIAALPNGNEKFTIGDVSFEMVNVAGGTHSREDGPTQRLNDYFIGATEVTQELWSAVMGETDNPSVHYGSKNPVEKVNWQDVQYFIEALNKITSCQFRLPTEYEWEFAAHGGTQSQGYEYSGSNDLDEVAWYKQNSYNETHPVGMKRPNELGIYDMCGNVMEWVWNPKVAYYTFAPLYGGAYHQTVQYCHPDKLNREMAANTYETIGFRLAMDGKNVVSNTSLIAPSLSPSKKIHDEGYATCDPPLYPVFPGGQDALKKYIQDNMWRYSNGIKSKEKGQVEVYFIVNKDGSISDVEVKKSISPELDDEAIRIVQSMPNWTPGKDHYGEFVRTEKRILINFE